jgi:transposase-like protein
MQRFVPIKDVFKGRHFDRQIIVWCVSWYTRFKLSLRDLVIMMADRGISVTHTTNSTNTISRTVVEIAKG